MKKLLTSSMILATVLLSGCQTVFLKDKTVQKDGTSHTVTAYQGSVLSENKMQDLDIDYNGVLIKVADWQTKGDAAFIGAVGNAIVNGIIAYSTLGTSEAAKAAVATSLSKHSTSEADEPSVEAVKPVAKPTPKPKPSTPVNLPPAGPSGRIILIGNSKTCGYCKTFQPLIDSAEFKAGTAGFAFVYADVKGDKVFYDAMWKKYGQGVTEYPTLVIEDTQGNIIGHIEGRANAVQPFTSARLLEMIYDLCPGCKPK